MKKELDYICVIIAHFSTQMYNFEPENHDGWLGRVMVLGSFQCRGIPLLLRIVGQGPAVLPSGAGRMDYIFLYFSSTFLFLYLVFCEMAEHDEILWFQLLKHKGSCQLLPRTSSPSTG